jgi:hypothetical protein
VADPRQGIGALRRRLRDARRRHPALFRLRLVLGIALTALIVILIALDPGEGVPERLAEGKLLRGIDYWRTYGWWTALVNSALLVVMLLTADRWFSRGPVVESAELAPPRRSGPVFALVVVAAMVGGAALAAPRLSQSFWDDEEYNVRYSMDGVYVVEDSGQVAFDPVRWRDTLWFYAIPNNHVAHTILARITVHGWRAISRPETYLVSESVVRVPAYLAGIASIGSIALLLRRIGFPAAGAFAAWFLALHPWHIRYASEARGYSMVLLLVTASLTLLVRTLHRGSWGRWALFGLAQFVLLWTYPGLVFHLIIVNAVAAAAIWHLHHGRPQLWQQAGRWAVVNLFGAMLWLQLMIPNLVQLPAYLERTKGARDMGGKWVASALSYLFSGMPWSVGQRGLDPVYPELIDVLQQAPAGFWTLLAVTLLAIVAGAGRLLAARGVRALLVAVLLLPGPITYALGRLRGDNIYVWYMVFVLPSLAVLLAVGFFSLVPRRLGPRLAAAVTVVAAAGFLSGHFWLTGAARTALHARSFKPARESVELTRPSLDPHAPGHRGILTLGYRDPVPPYYDPWMQSIEEAAEVRAFMERADAEGLELFVNFGYLGRIARHQPELLALVEDDERFEKVAVLHGFEPPWTRAVYRYRGGSTGGVVRGSGYSSRDR